MQQIGLTVDLFFKYKYVNYPKLLLTSIDNYNPSPHGSAKRVSVSDTVNYKSKREKDQWGKFDENWSFAIHEVPEEFRTEKKYQNFILAKQEEEEQKLILKSKPYHIEIEPTNICNLHCPLCSTGVDAITRKKQKLTLENFKKIIDEVKDTTILLALQNWGEPTLVKDLPKMIRYATDAGIWTHIATNFSVTYPDEWLEEFIKSGIGRLKLDIDGTTQEVYEKYRIGGSLDLLLKNARRAIQIKKENGLKYPLIQARMIVTKKNEHQIDDFKKLAMELDVDEMELGNIRLNPNTVSEEWLPLDQNYIYDTYLGERRVNPCHWPWSGLAINSDGGVSPCAIIDDANSDFGNVFETSVMDIWNSDYYVSSRSTWTKNAKIDKTTICNICKNDTHNPNLLRVGNTFSLTMDSSVKFRNK